MTKNGKERIEADLDMLRELARDCRAAGDDVAAVIEKASSRTPRMAGAGGLAEEFWELCQQGQQRHLDSLRRFADTLVAQGNDLDDVAGRIEEADATAADDIRTASRPTGE